jgi:hypothetical protein
MGRLVSCLAILVTLAACQSQLPIAQSYDLTYQRKMQAAYHWQVLAQDISNQVINRIATRVLPIKIVIQPEGPPTAFSQALEDMLITEFVEQGIAVLTVPSEDTIVLTYDVQVVRYEPGRFVREAPGTYALLGGGVIAVTSLVNDFSVGALSWTVAGAAAAAELGAGSYSEVSNTEVIINASLLWQGEYVARYTDIYYVPDADSGHYETEDGSVIVAGDDGTFSIVYDSYLRSLTNVREEAEQRCSRDGLLTSMTGRDMAHRMQTAYFRCYTP